MVMLIVIAAIGGWSVAARNDFVDVPGTVVTASGLDFGTVSEQPDFRHEIVLRNDGATAVSLSQIRGTCKCMNVAPAELELSAGEAKAVVVHLDLLPSDAFEAARDLRRFSARVLANVDDGSRRVQSWAIRGKVQRRVTVSPSRISFTGEHELVIGAKWPSVTALVSSREPNSELQDGQLKNARVRFEVKRQSPGQWQVTVTPRITRQPGTWETLLKMELADAGGNTIPVEIPVFAEVAQDIQSEPAILTNAAAAIGKEQRKPLFVRSVLGNKFRLIDVSTDSDQVTVRRSTQDELATDFLIFVTAKVSRQGPQLAGNVLLTAESNGNQQHLKIPVRYYGTTLCSDGD